MGAVLVLIGDAVVAVLCCRQLIASLVCLACFILVGVHDMLVLLAVLVGVGVGVNFSWFIIFIFT